MSRKLVTVREILNIQSIQDADAIEVATVDGWTVVVKKDQFKIGDKCVYFEIDSVVPNEEPFLFLEKVNFRIKTIRLRGQISQGIIFTLPEIQSYLNSKEIFINLYEIDGEYDLTEALGVTKYESNSIAVLSGEAIGSFPSDLVPKTDEERVQNSLRLLEMARIEKTKFIITEKLDGSSVTYIYSETNGGFMVCSRNLRLKLNEGNSLVSYAIENDIEEKLKPYKEIAIQGEIIGNGIQGNKYKLTKKQVRFFYAYSISEQRYFTVDEFLFLMNALELETVPIIQKDFVLDNTISIALLLEMADGQSQLNKDTLREGLVFNASEKTGYLRTSFKVISNKFLLKDK